MNDIQLRPYQYEGLARIVAAFTAGQKRVCYTLPTGGGKTHTFAYQAKKWAAEGLRVCILVHREELLDQVSDALKDQGCYHGLIKAGRPSDLLAMVQVASVFSLAKRLHLYTSFDRIIIDECHHAPAGSWNTVCDHYRTALILGVTATPIRMDGKGLDGPFDYLILGPTTQQLINEKYLVTPRMYAPSTVDLKGVATRGGDYAKDQIAAMMDRPTIYGDCIRHWQKLVNGAPTVAFCVSVEHAEHTAQSFRAAGISSVSIDGTLDAAERKQRIAGLRNGQVKVLTSCDLISEGFDLPGIHAAILLRPTKSLSLYLQQVGRALRTAPGKLEAIILDHVGNCDRHGPPQMERNWELTQDKPKSSAPVLSTCSECYHIFPAGCKQCPMCGATNYSFKRADARGPELKADAELHEIDPEIAKWKIYSHREGIRRCHNMKDLHQFGKAKGYKSGFAYKVGKELGFLK